MRISKKFVVILWILVSVISGQQLTRSVAAEDTRPELVIAMPTLPTSVNSIDQDNFALRLTINLFDPLIARDWASANGSGIKPAPALAESWKQVSPTELELKIRQGVKFHDGSTMSADDVAFTLSSEKLWGEKALTPDSIASVFSKVEVVDPSTVRITTKFPDPALISRLQTRISYVVPRTYFMKVGADKFGQVPIGTGPYKLEKLSFGDTAVLTAFDDYWGGKPPVKKITFKAVPEVASRVTGLLTGEYDIITSVPPDQIDLIKKQGAFDARSVLAENVQMLAFITTQTDRPTGNKLVRQAMAHAIDRTMLAKVLWGGLTTPPATMAFPLYGDFYDSKHPATTYDPALAKKLLEQAGYKGEGITLQYIGDYYINFDRAAQIMQKMWLDAGIKVTLSVVPDWTLLDLKPESKTNMYATSNNIAFPDPLSPIWTDWGAPTAWYVQSGRFKPTDEFSVQGKILEQSTDQVARKQAFDKMLSIWDDEVPAILLYQPVETYGVKNGLKWQPYSQYGMDFRTSNFTQSK